MTSRLGNFELIRELGTGAWGKVYLARQTTLSGRLVAVKTLLPHLAADERARQRFLNEAHDMARLSHPNIVQVIEVGEQDGTYYFAMTYVEGETMTEFLARRRCVPYAQAAEIVAQIAEALGHAHSRAVVHRDIKPGNILMDQQGRPVITDFGIAKVGEGSGLTMTGGTIGTPEFMSPEQAQGNPVDGRSDLYSLGVVLYYMTTGYVPFGGATPVAVGLKHLSEPPPDPCGLVADYPPWLAAIVRKALAKQPYERFATGEEMAATLRAGAASAPTAPVALPAPPRGPAAPQPAESDPPAAARLAQATPTARPQHTALISILLLAIFFVVGLMGTMLWLRLQPSARPNQFPTNVAVTPPVISAGGGGGSVTSAAQRDAVTTIRRLYTAIGQHDAATAIQCFIPDPNGTPPYGLDQPEAYNGIESALADKFRSFRQSGDEATIECDAIVQMSDGYFVTPFAYRLRRQSEGWLIEAISRLSESRRMPGRYAVAG